MQRVRSPAPPRPLASGAPVVGCVVRDRVDEVAGHESERQRAGAPQVAQQQRRQEHERGDQRCTQDGRRADERLRPAVVLRMPAAKWRQAVQDEAVQPVLDQRPAPQAQQRKYRDFQPPRARPRECEERSQCRRSDAIQDEIGAISRLAMLGRQQSHASPRTITPPSPESGHGELPLSMGEVCRRVCAAAYPAIRCDPATSTAGVR